jgi:hypothetical protein
MPIVHECNDASCRILTMGSYCMEHEAEREPVDPALETVRSTVSRLSQATLGAARSTRRTTSDTSRVVTTSRQSTQPVT